jgi:hypothetical protein
MAARRKWNVNRTFVGRLFWRHHVADSQQVIVFDMNV